MTEVASFKFIQFALTFIKHQVNKLELESWWKHNKIDTFICFMFIYCKKCKKAEELNLFDTQI